jgi:hypothetical protein
MALLGGNWASSYSRSVQGTGGGLAENNIGYGVVQFGVMGAGGEERMAHIPASVGEKKKGSLLVVTRHLQYLARFTLDKDLSYSSLLLAGQCVDEKYPRTSALTN